jgi:DNA adenine methylase
VALYGDFSNANYLPFYCANSAFNSTKNRCRFIPKYTIYTEPFVGGGALFWAKGKSEVEVINDTNTEVVNFYQTVQKNYAELHNEIQATLHSRE